MAAGVVFSLLGRADIGSQAPEQQMCSVLEMESFSPTQFYKFSK